MKQTQTDWEAAYLRGDTPWEKGKAHPALVDLLTESDSIAGEILVPGCGFGYDVRALSASANHVIGIDVAQFAIDKARSFPKIARERYLLADLFALPTEFDRKFDAVLEHTCFCAIEPEMRANYVETISRVLKPAGKMIAIFFLNPDHDEDGPPYGVSRAELDALFGAQFFLEKEWIPRRTYESREERELMRILRRL